MQEIEWRTASPFPELQQGQLHVWRLAMDEHLGSLVGLATILTAQEIDRADKFVFERHRRRYILSHHFLHTVLAGYLGLPPQDVRFFYGAHGKPALASNLPSSKQPLVKPADLHFNLAHSHGLALLGVTFACQIGVDIEYHRTSVDYEQLASHFFSPHESAALRALPEAQREAGFFNAWTRKEAYLKALGDGLARPLDSFDVTLTPGEPARLVYVDRFPGEPGRWHIFSFIPEPGYTAAVVVEENNIAVSFFSGL